MKDKAYRHGLVGAQIDVDLPLQIRALRKQQPWTQPQLAAATGMKQSRISTMEKPGGASFNLETLRRLAEAFDVALVVRFAPFSELLGWSDRFNPDVFVVPDFDHDTALEYTQIAHQALRSGKLIQMQSPSLANAPTMMRGSVRVKRTRPRKIRSASTQKLTLPLGDVPPAIQQKSA